MKKRRHSTEKVCKRNCPTLVNEYWLQVSMRIKSNSDIVCKHLCAWGNDAASEVITEARQLLVENYFQTPSSAEASPWPSRISERAPFY